MVRSAVVLETFAGCIKRAGGQGYALSLELAVNKSLYRCFEIYVENPGV